MSYYIDATGNVTENPTLRQTQTGRDVTNVKVAVNHRVKDRETDEYSDGQPDFFEIELWGRLARNACDSLVRGDRIDFRGDAHTETYQTASGRGFKKVVQNARVSVSLEFASVSISKNEKVA